MQGRCEGTSSAAFEILIFNCQMYFINLFVFNCLTLNVKLFIFKLSGVNFFSRNSCPSQTEENGCLWTYGRASLISDFKLTRENDNLLSSRHKYIFEVPHPVQEYPKMLIPDKRYRTNTVRPFWGTRSTSAYLITHTSVLTISVGSLRKYAKYKWDYGIRNFSGLDKLVRLCICSKHRVFPLPWCFFSHTDENIQAVKEACTVLREEVIIFSWCSRGLSLIETNLKKWILLKKSSCIKR